VVELENRINQGLRNHQAIIQNLKRQLEYIEKTQRTKTLPHTTNTKPRHEFVYKPPSISNENDKGDVEVIEKDQIEAIPTMPNPNPIMSNLPTLSPFLMDYTVHIPYTNVNTFADDVLLNHVGGEELNSVNGVETGRMTKKVIEKVDMDCQRNPTKNGS
nr:hypothetical protein [Tanacetum cinerariifolium]